MAWELTAYSFPPFVAAAISAVLISVTWSHRERPIAPQFAALMLAVCAWSLAYGIQLGYTDLESQLFWWRVGISIGGTIPTLWLVLALQYSDRIDRPPRRTMALLSVDPLAFALLVWTNGEHGLIWREAAIATSPTIAELTFGPGYLVHIAYAYLLVATGIALIVGVFLSTSRIYRRQAGVLVVGAVVPLGANVAFTLGVSPIPRLDLTTFAFTVTGVFFALALFRLRFLDLTPAAHRNVIDELGDCVVVVDVDGYVTDFNANAERLLDGPLKVGRPVDAILPDDAEGGVIDAEPDGTRRFYRVVRSPIHDLHDRLAGHVVAMRDITDRREYEQRLEVTNRLLRHNLRNDMNVIFGLADLLADELSGELEGRARTIGETARRVADMSEKAERMEATLGAVETTPVDAVEVVRETATRFRETDPNVSIELSAPDRAWVLAPGRELLSLAVDNLVENAIEHNDGDPHVRVSVEPSEGSVRIAVADDGPGIPDVEYEVLSEGGETPLRHGSGVGIWLVHWIATASGGGVSFAENEPRGSVVTVELPTR